MKHKITLIFLIGLAALLGASPVWAAAAPKVQVCHVPPGNPANAHMITISLKALKAHVPGKNAHVLDTGPVPVGHPPIAPCGPAEVDFLACRPTADINNLGFPVCDLQSGVADNDLVVQGPTGPLAVLEPDTFQHTATWESAPTTAPMTLLPGPVTLDLVMMNMNENAGSNDICWSKHIILPDLTEIVVVAPHCFENPLPAQGFNVCPFGALAPNISAACLATADLVSETVPSLIAARTVIPVGSRKEISVFCPGSSFLGVFFNDGLDVDGDGVPEYSKITEPVT